MKKSVFILFMLLSVKAAFAQLNADGGPNVFVGSIGIHQTFMNNQAFNSWSLSNYNKKYYQATGVHVELAYFDKQFDYGLHISGYGSFISAYAYIGKRLTSLHSKISSYLDLDFGDLAFDRSDIVPPGYVRTPDQEGKDLKLEYGMNYMGLTSTNFLNSMNFHFGKHKKISFNTGFYATVAYNVFNDRYWKYGYDDNANSTSDGDGGVNIPFNSVTIHNIPLLNRFFIEAGIFVGIGN